METCVVLGTVTTVTTVTGTKRKRRSKSKDGTGDKSKRKDKRGTPSRGAPASLLSTIRRRVALYLTSPAPGGSEATIRDRLDAAAAHEGCGLSPRACVVCGDRVTAKAPTDHVLSLIENGAPRFDAPSGMLLATHHPLNLAWCHPACNNEARKRAAISASPDGPLARLCSRLPEALPRVAHTIDTWASLMAPIERMEGVRLAIMRATVDDSRAAFDDASAAIAEAGAALTRWIDMTKTKTDALKPPT
jgi:hypothetical protein